MRRGIVIATVLMAMSVAVPGAPAATEFGNSCTGIGVEPGYTFMQLARASNDPLPLTAPSAGVVTQWKSSSDLASSQVDKLKVLRSTPSPNWFTVVGESTYQTIAKGRNSFNTRIPVQAGDRLGMYGRGPSGGGINCANTGNLADHMGFVAGDFSLEPSGAFVEAPLLLVAVSAVIEADKDGDGYGDETQDGCPQSAAYQGPCPTIALEAFPIALKRSVLVLVSASSESSVQVFGQVDWKPRHRGGALASKTRKPGDRKSAGVIVGLTGGTQTVSPGQIARFNVKLPKSVKRQLRQIPPGKSLKGTITARTTDLASRVTDRVINIHLKGQQGSGR